MSLQLPPSTSKCQSIKRKPNRRKAPTICFTSLGPGKSYISRWFYLLQRAHCTRWGNSRFSIIAKHQNSKFHSTLSDMSSTVFVHLPSHHSEHQHPSILWNYCPVWPWSSLIQLLDEEKAQRNSWWKQVWKGSFCSRSKLEEFQLSHMAPQS